MPLLGGAGSDWVDDERVRRAAWYLAAAFAFYYVQQRLWPAPAGVVVQGMVIGGLTALVAFGLALVYRANRIVNFAQGDLGGLPGALAVLLIAGPGWPYLLAVPAGLLAAVVLGALIEFLIIRRFFKAPRLILTVVTIGISGLLAGLEVALPSLFDLKTPPQTFPSPFDFTFTIEPIRFQGNAVIAMLAVPAAIAALMAFFRYTNVGLAIRASADSADRAALLGVPVKRIQTVVWVVATVLATMAIILRAGVIGLPIGSVLGPRILLRALTAGVIGRMERLPTIFVAAVGIGVIEQSIIWSTGRNLLIDPVLFLVVIGALLVQRRGRTSRVDDSESSSWQSAQVVRETPPELTGIPEVAWARRGAIALLLGFLVLLPAVLPGSRVNLVASMFIYGMLGISLVVLTGWAGQVSLGQVGFFAIGAAVAGYLTATRHWDLSIAVVAAGLVGAAAAIAIGLPALRIRGLFLAVTTLAFALATSSWFLNPEFVHWLPTGRIERPALFGRVDIHTEVRYYYLCLAALIMVIWAVKGVRTSRTGRVLIGVRENERGAQAFGVNAIAAKLTGFALSGFIAAFAGGLFVHHQQSLGISAYLPEESLRVFVMAVIGGLASVPGVLVGAAFIKGINYFSTEAPRAIQPLLQLSVTSIGLVFVLLVLPGGLGSVLYGIRDKYLRWVADRRGLVVPSFVADIRVEVPPSSNGAVSPIEVPSLAVAAGTGP